MTAAALFWGLLFGSVGFAYFMYGRKQQAIIPMIIGFVLMILPYLLTNTAALIVVGIVLAAIPRYVRL